MYDAIARFLVSTERVRFPPEAYRRERLMPGDDSPSRTICGEASRYSLQLASLNSTLKERRDGASFEKRTTSASRYEIEVTRYATI